ncbi:MAG: SDR family NAD(P)-dependent oxidoreductase [Rhodoplanes sp.]|jgi:NAD(P)-dependent dehydrogenase (short-subunit alcohol dehydrogenase family)
MADRQTAVIIGGTSGIGRRLAETLAQRGEQVFISGRDKARAQAVAKEIGGNVHGLGLDLAQPQAIADALGEVGAVDHLVLAAIERDENSVRKYDISRAIRLVTLKLVGYTEVIHALAPRLAGNASIVLFGGQARARPYPGSTTVTTVNGGVTTMVATLAVELAPVRVNAVHPGIVGDSPAWTGKPPEVLQRVLDRTPIKRLATMADVAASVVFLLDNQSVNGVNLQVDGGWLLM